VATPPEPDRYAAMVEAAATARRQANGWPWEDGPEERRDRYRRSIRTVLDAAGVPEVLAELAELEQAKARSFVATVGKLVAIRRALDGALTADDDESTTALAERVARVLRVRTGVIETLRNRVQRVETERAQAVAARDDAEADRDLWHERADQRLTDLVAKHDQIERLDAELDAAFNERDKARARERELTTALAEANNARAALHQAVRAARAERDKARTDLGAIGLTLAAVLDVPGGQPAAKLAELAAADLAGARGMHKRVERLALQRLNEVHRVTAERDEARAERDRLAGSHTEAAVRRLADDISRLRNERDDALAALAGVTPENYHTELRDRRNDDMAIRGILSPNGGPRVIAVEIGPTVAPAVEWLVSDRDSWRRLAEDFSPVVVAARALDAAWTNGRTSASAAREALRDAVAELDKVEGKRRDGWLAISTPYRAPETMTTRTVDGRHEMWDASTPPGGWVCAEMGDGVNLMCGQPVESEPCPVHHPADEPEPRTWAEDDPEPGPEVLAVRDWQGDRWKRRKGAWQLKGGSGTPWRWGQLAARWAPLTDATRKVTG
jgi:hypothetical protein